MPELDLHADAEGWSDNRDKATCEACGGPRVVFIPVWENGGGILTAGEIAQVLRRARLNVLDIAEREAAGKLEPLDDSLPEDVVMRVDGLRDGSFRAVILARGGDVRQTHERYGAGSVYTGAHGWRHGLALSGYTHQVTTPAEAAEGLVAYEGAPGILNFTRRPPYIRIEEEAREAFQLGRAVRDRTSRTTAWNRNAAGRASPRPPAAGDGGSDGEAQAAE